MHPTRYFAFLLAGDTRCLKIEKAQGLNSLRPSFNNVLFMQERLHILPNVLDKHLWALHQPSFLQVHRS
jgi:hypothetical protein